MMKNIIVFFIIAIILISGCTKQEKEIEHEKELENIDEPSLELNDSSSGLLKGVSLSPKSAEGDDFLDFFEKAEQTGNVVMWAGDWDGLSIDGGAPKVVTELASTYDYIPLIEVTYYTQGEGELIRPLTAETREAYKNNAVEFAKKYQPKYLGLGIEVNIMYEKSPDDFEEFVVFYNEVYDAVKEVSPNTKIFTVFQLEKMKGLSLWGTEEYDPDKAHWELIDEFKSEIVAFSTYPGLVYNHPSEIPEDHYTEIKSYTKKPIAFTEIGWHAAASPEGWESSNAEQAEFIKTFFNLTEDLDMKIAVWSFLYDPDIIEPFNTMGLRRSDGTARPSWDAWIEGGE